MLSLAVLICALLGANAEIPTWDASCVGSPLKSLADHKVESAGGFLATTLTVDVITLKTPNTTFKTRAYNGALGGPRLVLQAGDRVELTLVNNLEDRDNTGEWNQPRKPNTTNLHLHGMHVSGRRRRGRRGRHRGSRAALGIGAHRNTTYKTTLAARPDRPGRIPR